MRREKFALALLMSVAAVFVGASGCNGEKPAPAAKAEVVAPASRSATDLQSDTVSGCVYGAALVKVLIDLQPKNGHCVAEVTPASVCVAPGGVVRFKIANACSALGDLSRPALEITKPEFKRKLNARPDRAPGLPDVFENCSLRVPRIDRAASHVVWCDIGAEAIDGFYKYGLRGQIDPLDPDVEVRPGGGNK